MWYQFVLENLHFSINVFTAMVFFSVSWLYWDAWLVSKKGGLFVKILGFLLLSISFLIHSTFLESDVLKSSLLDRNLSETLVYIFKFIGYFLILVALLTEKLQKRPKLDKTSSVSASFFMGIGNYKALYPALPALPFIIGIIYLRMAVRGLERHLKKVAYGFFVISVSELLSLSYLFRNTKNPNLYELTAPFASLWIAENLILLFGALLIGSWIWGYLHKRLITQLYMVFCLSFFIIFIISTQLFTGILLDNLRSQTMKNLGNDALVFGYAIDLKKENLKSSANRVSENPNIIKYMEKGNTADLSFLLESALLDGKHDSLVVVDSDAKVIGRGEDSERVGNSLSEDTAFKRALQGESLVFYAIRDGAVLPEIIVKTAVPIKEDKKILGAVIIIDKIDNLYIEGIKKTTSLDTSIYAGNVLSATTVTVGNSETKPLGIKEENEVVKDMVIKNGTGVTEPVTFLGVPYFSSYLPFFDQDGVAIGMFSVSKPQISVLETASKSIEITFIYAAIFIVLSILPSYFLSKHISDQFS